MPAAGPAPHARTGTMPRRAPILRIAMAASALAGCAGAPQPAANVAEIRSSVQLSARLLDASDTTSAAFDRIVNKALMESASPRELYSYMLTRAEATANVRALALGADPAGALVDLYVFSRLAVWACENRIRLHPEIALTPCGSTYGVLREEVAQVAREYMTPEKLARVDGAIEAWMKAHPDRMVIGLIRLSDLSETSGTAPVVLEQVAPSMFSPVTEAAQQLQEARLLGYQALWLASRLPMSLAWQLDATIYGAISSDPAARAISNVESLSDGIAGAHEVFQNLAASNSALSAQAAALGDRVQALEKSVATLGAGLSSNLTGVSSSLGSLGTEVRDLDGADELATRVVRQATWSGVALISLAAGSLALVLWSHRHHARRTASQPR
ncbi:MAG: hypothetical protein FGM37_08750 [Phycisphaerales bacterium]|nr:hypothetical protein [Phycisphaerales bacterium]